MLTGGVAFNNGFTPMGGEVLFGLTSLSDFGQISIAGNATLGGTVGVVWLGGFASAALVLVFLGRIALRLLQEAERHARTPPIVSIDTRLETMPQDIIN